MLLHILRTLLFSYNLTGYSYFLEDILQMIEVKIKKLNRPMGINVIFFTKRLRCGLKKMKKILELER